MVSGDLAGFAARLYDAERALAAMPDGDRSPWADTTELQTLPATIAIYRASIAQARGDVAGTAEHARRALDFARPNDHLARGGALGFLGLAAWANGDVTSAVETFTQAVASLHAADNLVDELSSTVTLADMWLAAGRPSKARQLYKGALQLAEAHGQRVADATDDLHVGISEIDIEVGDLQSARRHLEIAAAIGDRSPLNERRYRWFVAMGMLANADGDPEEAVNHLTQAEQLHRPTFLPDVGLLRQYFLDEVVDDVPVVPGEPGDESADVRPSLHRDRGELERSDPAFGSSFQRGDVVRGEVQTGDVVEVGGDFVGGEAQVGGADLDQFPAGPQPSQRQERVGSAADHQVDVRWEVLEQERHAVAEVGPVDQVVVVEHQDHLIRCG